MDDLISVIVPSYNSEKTIERCIKSMLEQTYDNWEMIIVDDGSTDNSATIIKNCVATDPRIKYTYQQNAGVSNARNVALSLVKGKYTAFLDSDDWYESTFLEKLKNAIDKDNCNIACSAYRIVNGESGRDILKSGNQVFTELDVLSAFLFNTSIQGFMCNKLFLSSVLENSFFDSKVKICEDLLLLCKLYSTKQLRMSYVNEPLYNYWITGMGATFSPAVMVDNVGGSQLFNTCMMMKSSIKKQEEKKLIERFAGERLVDFFFNSIYNKKEINKQAKKVFIGFLLSDARIKSKVKFVLGYLKKW